MSQFALRIAGTEADAPAVYKARPTGRWITAAEAANRAGLHVGNVRKLIAEEGWATRGLARQVKLASGQQGWEVDEGCDPRFSVPVTPEQRFAAFDWSSVPQDTATAARARFQIINAINAEIAAANANRGDARNQQEIVQDFIDRTGLQKSARSVLRWIAKFHAEELPWSLVDARAAKPADEQPNDFGPFYKLLEDWYLNQGEPKMAACYKLASREAIKANLPIPCLRHAQRHFEAMSIARKIWHRKGEKEFDDRCAAYCQRDFTRIRVIQGGRPVVRPMQSDDIWVADHHPCDVIVQTGLDAKGRPIFKRPWLSAWQDVRSRRIMGYRFLLTDPNSSTVMLVLRDAVINAGLRLPRFVYTDNGKDYDAWFWDGVTKRQRKAHVSHDQQHFAGIYAQLGIGHIHATPYNAKAKPIERFFRTFEESFNVFEPTYCGRNPQEKPEQLEDRLNPAREQISRLRREGKDVPPELLRRTAAPVFEEWAARAIDWIDHAYHHEAHTGHGMDGRSPMEIYAAHLGTAAALRPVTREQLDCCLQLVNRPIKVGRNGITVSHKTYGKGDPALRALFGREVLLRIDPADVRYATVWSLDGQRLATLAENDLAIFDTTPDATHREYLAKQRRHNRQLKEVQKRGMRPVKSAAELMIEDAVDKARQRHRDNPLPPPAAAGIELVNVGLDTASNDDRPAFKAALGAERQPLFNATLAAMAEDD